MVYWILVNLVSLGEGRSASVHFELNIFAYGAEENVEMHCIYFGMLWRLEQQL